MNQARDTLKVMLDMYSAEGAECKARGNASMQVLNTYYQQPLATN